MSAGLHLNEKYWNKVRYIKGSTWTAHHESSLSHEHTHRHTQHQTSKIAQRSNLCHSQILSSPGLSWQEGSTTQVPQFHVAAKCCPKSTRVEATVVNGAPCKCEGLGEYRLLYSNLFYLNLPKNTACIEHLISDVSSPRATSTMLSMGSTWFSSIDNHQNQTCVRYVAVM